MKWICALDKLPEIKDKTQRCSKSENVIVLDSSGIMYVAYLNYYGISGHRKEEEYSWSEVSTGCGCCSTSLEVTHWMPLPSFPIHEKFQE